MSDNFKTTTNHAIIRNWVENHGGQPALIVDPHTNKTIGLRVDFPGKADEALMSQSRKNKVVSWDEFFSQFENQALAFSYMDDPQKTDLTDAYMFIKREALSQKEEKLPIDPEELARASRDDLPEYSTHAGSIDDPHLGRIEPITPDDVLGEEGPGGTTPDPETDDDATDPARALGITDPEDKSA